MTPRQFAKLCRAVAAGPIGVDLADMPPPVDLASLADRLESGDLAGAFRYVYSQARKDGLSQAMSLAGSGHLRQGKDGPVIEPNKSDDDLRELFQWAYQAKIQRAEMHRMIVAGGDYVISGHPVRINPRRKRINPRRKEKADEVLTNWTFRSTRGRKRKLE